MHLFRNIYIKIKAMEQNNYENSETQIVSTNKGLVGIFDNRTTAETAYELIHNRGYDKSDVNLIMSHEARDLYFSNKSFEGDPVFTEKDMISEAEPQKVTNVILKDAAIGAGIGITIGAIFGAIAAIGTSIIIPGAGLIIAGPLASGIISAAGLGIGGGMIGGLFGFEVPDTHTTIEDEIKKNKILVGIHPKNKEDSDFIIKEWNNLAGARVVTE